LQKVGEEVKSKKQLAAEKAAELNALFKPVVDKKAQVAAGVDPKSVVCQFFKAGTCTKGNRCKFSHDLSKERKAAKIDVYSDRRDGEEGGEDTMEDWDENKLREVVDKKHGASNRTDIICKFFLDAIEQKKYGWFWSCPNGGTQCMYRHALPPGFVLSAKKKKDEEEDEENKVTLEDQLEQERRALTKSTPLTHELFLKWKEDKRLAKEKAAADRKVQIKAGKTTMSGREAFEFNPDLIAGDDDLAYDEDELRKVLSLLSSLHHHRRHGHPLLRTSTHANFSLSRHAQCRTRNKPKRKRRRCPRTSTGDRSRATTENQLWRSTSPRSPPMRNSPSSMSRCGDPCRERAPLYSDSSLSSSLSLILLFLPLFLSLRRRPWVDCTPDADDDYDNRYDALSSRARGHPGAYHHRLQCGRCCVRLGTSSPTRGDPPPQSRSGASISEGGGPVVTSTRRLGRLEGEEKEMVRERRGPCCSPHEIEAHLVHPNPPFFAPVGCSILCEGRLSWSWRIGGTSATLG
jgi:hypothetical protein